MKTENEALMDVLDRDHGGPRMLTGVESAGFQSAKGGSSRESFAGVEDHREEWLFGFDLFFKVKAHRVITSPAGISPSVRKTEIRNRIDYLKAREDAVDDLIASGYRRKGELQKEISDLRRELAHLVGSRAKSKEVTP